MNRTSIIKVAAIFLCAVIFPIQVFAQTQHPVEVYFFYSETCPHCHEMKLFLAKLIQNRPSIKINSYEVTSNQDNQALLLALAKAYGIEAEGVPVLFVGDKAIEGNYQGEVENAINNCTSMGCDSPLKKLDQNANVNTQNPQSNFIMEFRWVILGFAVIFLAAVFFRFRKKEN